MRWIRNRKYDNICNFLRFIKETRSINREYVLESLHTQLVKKCKKRYVILNLLNIAKNSYMDIMLHNVAQLAGLEYTCPIRLKKNYFKKCVVDLTLLTSAQIEVLAKFLTKYGVVPRCYYYLRNNIDFNYTQWLLSARRNLEVLYIDEKGYADTGRFLLTKALYLNDFFIEYKLALRAYLWDEMRFVHKLQFRFYVFFNKSKIKLYHDK